MEKKLLTSEEITKLKELQENYNMLSISLGDIELKKMKLDLEKENIVSLLKDLKNKENDINNVLKNKYGAGSINIDTGEFISF